MSYFRPEIKSHDDHNITAIAIDDDKNSQCAVKWAVDNIINNRNPHCILVHVLCRTMNLAERMMNNVPKEGRPPTPQELQQFFLPYRGFCARRGIETKEVVIYDIDVPSALIGYIINNKISNIVLGASNRNALLRKFKNHDTPSILLKSAPESCAVYVIAKGKVQTFRLASQPQVQSFSFTNSHCSSHSLQQYYSPSTRTSNTHNFEIHRSTSSPLPDSQVSYCESWRSESSDKLSPIRSSEYLNPTQNDKRMNSFYTQSSPASTDGHSSELWHGDFRSDASEVSSGPISIQSTDISFENLDFSPRCGNSKIYYSSQRTHLLEAEIRRLKHELQQSMELFSSVTREAILAKQMVREFHRLQTSESKKTEEIKLAEGAASTLAEMESQKKKAAFEAVQAAKRLADLEAQKRNAEMRTQQESEERMKNMRTMADNEFMCRRYNIEEIEVATDHFAASNKIGEGGYGPVFKGNLNHIAVAIKILRPDLSQGQKQFRQEIDVLSSMRHPHMVILLGACPEYGCLVYEYMENGSLEDRLLRKDNTPPIPWRTRFKIAFEIATALLFLHKAKPEPLVHRDLKPANILLDRNYVSKVGDVGLARLVPESAANSISQYYMTAAAGTFCYIDPEYQQTGMLGVKSDLYSFGVVLLQLLTGKPPMGLSYKVDDSIGQGTFSEMLDQSLTDWPVEECLSLAKLAVKCCELRKKDRPDLSTVVLPELKRLADFAMATEPETTIPIHGPADLIFKSTKSFE